MGRKVAAEKTMGLTQTAASYKKFGFISIEPGITPLNMWVLMYAAFVSIALATFDAFGTPYVLSESIGVPLAEQGFVVGRLNVYTEILLLMVFTPLGVLSDRIGRRMIYAMGFGFLGLSYALFPFASSVTELALIRVFYSLGLAGVTGMLATVIADYVVPEHRGRIVGLTGMFNGLGIVMSALLLAKLPSVFVGLGYDNFEAGKYTLYIVAGLCVVSALIVGGGLHRGTPPEVKERPGARELFAASIQAATENPRIAVAYASAFVARGDLVVVGTFLVLWGKVAAVEGGMETAAAIDAGRIPFVIAQSAALIGAIAAIFLIDRVHRMSALAGCMGLAAIGYTFLLFVDNPLDSANIPFFILLGLGQVAAFLGSTTLIGKEAPAEKRGAVVGAFSVFGAMGILVMSGTGGALFDAIDPRAPFLVLGVMNLVVMASAIYVRLKAPGKAYLSTALT
jgi:MFS family permease